MKMRIQAICIITKPTSKIVKILLIFDCKKINKKIFLSKKLCPEIRKNYATFKR